MERLPEDVEASLDVLLRVHHIRNSEFLVEPAVIADVNLHEAEVSGVADHVRLIAALPLNDCEGDFKRDALLLCLFPDVPLQLVAHGYVVEEFRLLFGLRTFLRVGEGHIFRGRFYRRLPCEVCCGRRCTGVSRNERGDCAEKRNGRNLHLSFKRIHNQVWWLLRASQLSSVRRGRGFL